MQIDVYDTGGQVVTQTELDDSVWGIEPNIAVMHQALVRQQANARQGTHDTKTRGEVSGGGRKPWRQKGTGRARQGSTRSPQWVGGGVVFGPHPRSYEQRMPRKMRRLAIRSVLSAKVRDSQLTIVQGLETIEPKTKTMMGILAKLPEARSVLIVTPGDVEPVRRAAGNLPGVMTIHAPYLNVRDVLKYERLVVTPDAVAVIEQLWAVENGQAAPRVPEAEPAMTSAEQAAGAAASLTQQAAAAPMAPEARATAPVAPAPDVTEAPTSEAAPIEPPGGAAASAPVGAETAAPAVAGAVVGTGEKECPAGYSIKGNASSMIYHQPGERYYNVTVPEMCFATEADAVAAGYRPYKHAAAEEE